ncbi:uncharacterized protein LOC115326770 [Ixodes scapularis]|uniref:uncharacterized protein LOC115326770 n=1 Tax=Ixodes scapularis TaxID=6945 RepID=UPI001C393CFF|nr:uncharacterized protein LOC115326770 [Ixodes scapularis]
MAGSNGAATTAPVGRGTFAASSSADDYKVVLPPIPMDATILNSVLLHCDLRGRPYRIEDFRQELKRCAVLSEIVALGAFQMNHVWLATLRTPEAKKRLIDCKELKVKDLRCVVIDPSSTEVRLRLHWVPYHVTDDAVSKFLEPYGKVIEVAREKWRVEGFEGIESTTRVARMTLKSGVTPDGMPHQLRLQGANVLIVIPGRAPVCLRCKRAGHIRRDCRVPKCSVCSRFGHEKEECVKTYARVTGGAAAEDLSPLTMDVDEAERSAQGQQDEALPSGEPCSHPVGADGSTEASPVKDKKEVAGGFPEPGSAAPPPMATPMEKTVAPREASPPTSEKAPSEGHDTMDETTESIKRGLDENPPSTPGMTPRPNPWMERTKKGRFQPTPTLTPDDRRRLNSK